MPLLVSFLPCTENFVLVNSVVRNADSTIVRNADSSSAYFRDTDETAHLCLL